MKRFNIKLLKKNQSKIEVKRDKTDTTFLIDSIHYYEHFISKNIEYIFFPFYNFFLNKNLLLRHKFNIQKKLTYNECTTFAYRPTDLPDTYKQTHDITICTLFYHEKADELNYWYNYYRKQGVEQFFMYYNGDLNDVIDTLPQHSDVQYLEWSHPYWIVDERIKEIVDTKAPRVHNAQLPLFNSHMKKIGLHCNYTLLIDIDEFLYINKNTTIKTFLQNKQCHLYTSHRFAYFEDKETLHSTLYHTSEVSPRNGKTILFNKSILPSTIINIHKTPQSVHYYPLKLLHIKPKQEQFLYKEKILNFNEIF